MGWGSSEAGGGRRGRGYTGQGRAGFAGSAREEEQGDPLGAIAGAGEGDDQGVDGQGRFPCRLAAGSCSVLIPEGRDSSPPPSLYPRWHGNTGNTVGSQMRSPDRWALDGRGMSTVSGVSMRSLPWVAPGQRA